MTVRYFRIYYCCIHIFKLLFLKADSFTVDCIYMCERLRNNLKEHKRFSKGFESFNRFLFIVSFISFDRIIFLVLTKKGNKKSYV